MYEKFDPETMTANEACALVILVCSPFIILTVIFLSGVREASADAKNQSLLL